MLSILLFETESIGTDITWMMWVAFGFFATMVLIGWLTSRKQQQSNKHMEDHPGQDEHH